MQEQTPSQAEQTKADEYLNRASAYLDRGDLESALAECATALRLVPNWAVAHNLRGVILDELGRVEEALAAYREAAQLDPDFAEAHLNPADSGKELLNSRPASAARGLTPKRLQIGLGVGGSLLLLIVAFLVLRGFGLMPGENPSAPTSTGPMLISGSDQWQLMETALATNAAIPDDGAFSAEPGTMLLVAQFECVTHRSPLDILYPLLFLENPSTSGPEDIEPEYDGPVVNLGPADGCYSVSMPDGFPNAFVIDSGGKQYPVIEVAVHCRGEVAEAFTLVAIVHEDVHDFSLHFAGMSPIELGK